MNSPASSAALTGTLTAAASQARAASQSARPLRARSMCSTAIPAAPLASDCACHRPGPSAGARGGRVRLSAITPA
ncbi:MAG TPA: hypothetical protein VF482_10530, partial [Trebonia sp.]